MEYPSSSSAHPGVDAHPANSYNGVHDANYATQPNNDAGNYNPAVDNSQQQYNENYPAGGRFTEEWDASQRGSSIIDGGRNGAAPRAGGSTMQRSASVHSYNVGDEEQLSTGKLPSRGNTLKKKSSMRRNGSLGRGASRRSARAGSVKSLALQSSSDRDESHSAFFCPVPTSGNPTEILINRFQSWRKVLKDLIAYFREIQNHYEHRGKALIKLANTSNNIQSPPGFLKSAGIDDALQFLRVYNKNAIAEASKARDIEEDVILALTGLRSDLQQKIKEIKNLSGDFKNTVEKEMDSTRKAVRHLQDVLGKNEADDASTTGKLDPFLLRLAVDRQVERQLDEENYLHQAYLNLENSGRELESIVVGEIQKAYNAYAGILKREADNAYGVIEELRDGPISMPKDQEWIHFVTHDEQFVDPTIPLRSAEQIHYPGQDHVAAQEIRAGLLERKSKYLKSYTAGWYVLSTTHLHEFKSADKGQAPVMSLYLPEQKVGSHSTGEGSSNKFVLKGRQTGTLHRGHTWVFRAESHDTMMAWYEDIKALTEKTPEERNQFVRHHSRSLSQSSRRSARSASSDGLNDDDDEEPFSAGAQIDVNPGPRGDSASRRSQPGGRFPSDIQVNAQRGLQAPRSTSSLSSSAREQQRQHSDAQAIGAATALPGSAMGAAAYGQYQNEHDQRNYGGLDQVPVDEPSSAVIASHEAQYDGVNPYTSEPARYPEHQQQAQEQYYQQPVQQHAQQPGPIDQQQPQSYQQDRTFVAPVVTSLPERTAQPAQVEEPQAMSSGNESPLAEDQGQQASGSAYAPTAIGAIPTKADPVPAPEASGPYVTTDGTQVGGGDLPRRPTNQTSRNESVNTISNLHVPGGYPRNSMA
ncbi:PH domain-containing protein [Emericellopsis atlantica]|uniref:PH domain-containing protein n=1 Tax=Emericellopsis atlantica TaxID=2614577 RepID=A0A9P8CKP7_9HYPO|nr:PH domain-containing protein [Emericellopsis atlantica]KAG9250170.1 PH domain-containing protein [Emericellopsis atlantica]